MKIFKMSIFILIVLIFSAGFVFAEDTNQSDSGLQVADGDVISAGEVKTYKDLLNNDMTEDGATLTSDYAYNAENDIERITVSGRNGYVYTINGNNHTVDGSGKVGVFRFTNVTVVINDLVIKNCGQSAFILQNSTVTFNNVVFDSNHDSSSAGAIYAYVSTVNVNNALFKDNIAPQGSAIYLDGSELKVEYATFYNKESIGWAMIYAQSSAVTVMNSIFANSTSKYATAIYGGDSRIAVYNSKFTNLYANFTAGAIGVKLASNVIVRNCEFENVRSAKNGGALFIDINGDTDLYLKGTSVINETKFVNCSSEFGGAVLQLGGYLNVLYSDFINNHAKFDGGAIYASNATFYSGKATFLNNTCELADVFLSRGGALYLDYSQDIEIEYCNFTHNKAFEGGAIYLFDTDFLISNTTSTNNVEFIHSYFPGKGLFKECIIGNDTYVMNDNYYPWAVNFTGKKFDLNPIKVNGSVTDSSFDLRKFNAVTSVKNQGQNGACWAFGAAGALESAFLKATGIELDISENNIQNSEIRYSFYGNPSLTEGGLIYSGLGYFLSWLGVVNAPDDVYDELGKISPVLFTQDSYHITDAVVVDPIDINSVKDALIKYGALTIFVNGANPNSNYYNNATYASYCDNSSLGNHFVTLVGWDDNFSKDNFKLTPKADGAWICKNSWGTDWGDKGYFYLSYYDAPLRSNYAIGYVINNTDLYNKLYQLDVSPFNGYYSYDGVDRLSYTNKFDSIDNDLISAVGTYFENNKTLYTIKVYVNNQLLHSQSGKSLYSGFQTIKLDKQIVVNSNETFSVEIEVNANSIPITKATRLFFEKGTSVVNGSRGTEDLSSKGMAASIKVYTFENSNNITYGKKYFNKSDTLVVESNIEGAVLTISQNGKSMANASVKSGKAVFNMQFNPGNYSITTLFNDTEIVDDFEIATSILVLDEYERDYGEDLVVESYFFDYEGNLLSNVTVPVSIDNTTFEMNTDVNGSLPIELNNLSLGTHELILVNPATYEESLTTIYVKTDSEFNSTADNDVLTVNVSKNATGNITVIIGNETYVESVENGSALFDLADLAIGEYNATVIYSGDDKYYNFTKTLSFNLENKVYLSADNVTKYYMGSERLVAYLLDSESNPIINATVKFQINNVTYTRKTNENGSASIALGLNSGEYDAVISADAAAEYGFKSVNVTVKINPTVNGTDVVKVYRNGTQYYATFRDSEGNYLANGTQVRFNINGVYYDRKVNGNEGLAKLNLNLEQGEYILTAINLENGEMQSNSITILPRITENSDLVKYYRNASQYTVKVIGDDGKAVGAGENVTFNINGVFYTRTTNASGIAKLNINLEAGDYIITAEYGGCRVSNNISVLPTLNATDLIKTYGTSSQFVATLVDGQGNPYAGQSVQFNINGVFYNRTTDSAGNAKLNINLQPGEYIITSSYGGCNIANTVKVNA